MPPVANRWSSVGKYPLDDVGRNLLEPSCRIEGVPRNVLLASIFTECLQEVFTYMRTI
jgi:hypothetical protein